MDREVCLEFIKNEITDLHHNRIKLLTAYKNGNFRAMEHALSAIEFTNCVRLRNLVNNDLTEDWGRIAQKEKMEQEAREG